MCGAGMSTSLMTFKELVRAIRKSISNTQKEVDQINHSLYVKELEEANPEKNPNKRLHKLCLLRDKCFEPDDSSACAVYAPAQKRTTLNKMQLHIKQLNGS
jgi:hypothetical protein